MVESGLLKNNVINPKYLANKQKKEEKQEIKKE